MDPGKCLTIPETRISSAHKIKPSFPWATEGRNSQHTDKHEVHHASNSRLLLLMHTLILRSLGREMDTLPTPTSAGTLRSTAWGHGGVVTLLTSQRKVKISQCSCQNCTQAPLAHETIPQCDHLPLSTLDITADHGDQSHPLRSNSLFRKRPRDSFHTIMARQTTNSY